MRLHTVTWWLLGTVVVQKLVNMTILLVLLTLIHTHSHACVKHSGWQGRCLGNPLQHLFFCFTSASAARTRQRRWARPAAPRHAHPDWMGDGLVSKQMKHTPSSPWLTSSPRATPSFISARQQGTQTPAALLKLLQSCQSPPRGS